MGLAMSGAPAPAQATNAGTCGREEMTMTWQRAGLAAAVAFGVTLVGDRASRRHHGHRLHRLLRDLQDPGRPGRAGGGHAHHLAERRARRRNPASARVGGDLASRRHAGDGHPPSCGRSARAWIPRPDRPVRSGFPTTAPQARAGRRFARGPLVLRRSLLLLQTLADDLVASEHVEGTVAGRPPGRSGSRRCAASET